MKKRTPLGHLYHKIITFGCSYTAGSELLDHEIHRHADFLKRRYGNRYFYEHYGAKLSQEQLASIDHRQRQLVWSAEIARRSSLALDNRAMGGSSLACIVDLIERAWYAGELRDPGVLVLVGVTTPNRGIWWPNSDQFYDQYDNFLLGQWHMPDHWHGPTILDFLSDQYLLHTHLSLMLRLVQISDSLQGRLIMFDMLDFNRYIDELSEQHSFRRRWREITESGHTRFDRHLNSFVHKNEKHAGGHPRATVHAKFALWAERQIL